jgi:hypothetical protein
MLPSEVAEAASPKDAVPVRLKFHPMKVCDLPGVTLPGVQAWFDDTEPLEMVHR